MRSTSEKSAMNDLLEKVDIAKFEETFKTSVDNDQMLINVSLPLKNLFVYGCVFFANAGPEMKAMIGARTSLPVSMEPGRLLFLVLITMQMHHASVEAVSLPCWKDLLP